MFAGGESPRTRSPVQVRHAPTRAPAPVIRVKGRRAVPLHPFLSRADYAADSPVSPSWLPVPGAGGVRYAATMAPFFRELRAAPPGLQGTKPASAAKSDPFAPSRSRQSSRTGAPLPIPQRPLAGALPSTTWNSTGSLSPCKARLIRALYTAWVWGHPELHCTRTAKADVLREMQRTKSERERLAQVRITQARARS